MRGYSFTKSTSFQTEKPSHEFPHSSKVNEDFGASVYSSLCSWLNLRDFMSIRSIAEMEKIRNGFAAIFQANQKKMVKRHRKAKCKEMRHIVKIDLNKIDKNLKLSNSEKKKLRHILNKIEYREFGAKSNKKEIEREKEKSVVIRKQKVVVKDKHKGRTKNAQSLEKSKERMNRRSAECKNCSLCSEAENKSHARRNQRSHLTNITPSEERIFKTIMNLDRSCCGDSFKTLFDPKSGKTFITQNQNINIENLELKYVQPTCLLQYRGLEKAFSNVAFGSHFGAGACPRQSNIHFFQDPLTMTKAMHDNNDTRNSHSSINDFPTSMSKLNNIYIRKEDKISEMRMSTSRHQQMQCEDNGEFDLKSHRQSLRTYQDKTFQEDSEISKTLLASGEYKISAQCDCYELNKKQCNFRGEEKGKCLSEPGESTKIKKKTSKFKKFKNFAKKCFCISGKEDDSERYLRRHSRKDEESENARLKRRVNSPNVKVKPMLKKSF